MKKHAILEKDTSDKISKHLFDFLATSYALYLKTQNFHWNVKGTTFFSLHTLFQQQYEELAEAVDEIAERIATLGSFVDGSFSKFSEHSLIKDEGTHLNSNEMLKKLIEGHETLVKLGSPFISKFQKLGDEVSADLMIKRLTFHEKSIWMLASQLEKI